MIDKIFVAVLGESAYLWTIKNRFTLIVAVLFLIILTFAGIVLRGL